MCSLSFHVHCKMMNYDLVCNCTFNLTFMRSMMKKRRSKKNETENRSSLIALKCNGRYTTKFNFVRYTVGILFLKISCLSHKLISPSLSVWSLQRECARILVDIYLLFSVNHNNGKSSGITVVTVAIL